MKSFLLIDDHEVVRAGVTNVLRDLFKPCLIKEAGDEKSALQQLRSGDFDVVLMDVQIPNTDTAALVEFVRNNYPKTRVLMFSMSQETIYAKRFLKAGAMGFVSKNAGLGELRRAIELVLNNRRYISENLAQHLATEVAIGEVTNPFNKLSAREFDIASQLIQGKSITEIANLLSLNTSTVGTYKARVMEKLNIKNLTELIELSRLYMS